MRSRAQLHVSGSLAAFPMRKPAAVFNRLARPNNLIRQPQARQPAALLLQPEDGTCMDLDIKKPQRLSGK